MQEDVLRKSIQAQITLILYIFIHLLTHYRLILDFYIPYKHFDVFGRYKKGTKWHNIIWV